MKPNSKFMMVPLLAGLCAGSASAQTNCQGCSEENWQDKAITPVTSALYFEDPRITSEVRPIFINQKMPDTYHYYHDGGVGVPLGGTVRVYAVQLRYAVTERLGLIATKDGYIEFLPNHTLSHEYGWANLAAGVKYAVVDDRENEFIVTPGLTIEVPTGNTDVSQGKGDGVWNAFVSAEKAWGNFHLTGNAGCLIPNNFSEQTAQAHYSLQLDYYICQYFIPFFAANGVTILTEGEQLLLGSVPLNTEMYDLIDFGSSNARGSTQLTVGGGVRSKLLKTLDLGIAYEVGVTDAIGILDSRLTVDLTWRF